MHNAQRQLKQKILIWGYWYLLHNAQRQLEEIEGMSMMRLRQVSEVTMEVVADCGAHGRVKGESEMCGGQGRVKGESEM